MRPAALLSLLAVLVHPIAVHAAGGGAPPVPSVQAGREAAPRDPASELLVKSGAASLAGVATTTAVGIGLVMGAALLYVPLIPGGALISPLLAAVVGAGASTFLAINGVTGDALVALVSMPVAVASALAAGAAGAIGGLAVGARFRTSNGNWVEGAIIGFGIGASVGAGLGTAAVTAGGLLLAGGPSTNVE